MTPVLDEKDGYTNPFRRNPDTRFEEEMKLRKAQNYRPIISEHFKSVAKRKKVTSTK